MRRVFCVLSFVVAVLFAPSARADSWPFVGVAINKNEVAANAGLAWGRHNRFMMTAFGEAAVRTSTESSLLSLNLGMEWTLSNTLVIGLSGGLGGARENGAWHGFGTITPSLTGTAPISPFAECRFIVFPAFFGQAEVQKEIRPMTGAKIRLTNTADAILGLQLDILIQDEATRLAPGFGVAFHLPFSL